MKEEQIQTQHPQPGKTNKLDFRKRSNAVKETLLAMLAQRELTHKELMEELYGQLQDSFEGNVQWYGETVKLDLEARNIIERTKTKPEKYRLTSTNS